MIMSHENEIKPASKNYIVKYIGAYNQEFIDQTILQYDNSDHLIIVKINDSKTRMEVTVLKNQAPSGKKEILLENDNSNTGC